MASQQSTRIRAIPLGSSVVVRLPGRPIERATMLMHLGGSEHCLLSTAEGTICRPKKFVDRT